LFLHALLGAAFCALLLKNEAMISLKRGNSDLSQSGIANYRCDYMSPTKTLVALCLIVAVSSQAFTASTRPVKHNKPQPYVPEPNELNSLSDNGHKLLWLAFFALFLPGIYFMSEMYKCDDGRRYFHFLTTMIAFIASLAYLTMATGHGVYIREFDGREFYYMRYIDWTITTPLMLLDILGFAGASADTKYWVIGCDILMIVAGLIGGFVDGEEKYYFWFFGVLVFLPILYQLLEGLKGNLANADESVRTLFNRVSVLTAITWSCYPIVWLAGEGHGNIDVDTECICYVLLDVLAKSLFGIIIISARDATTKLTAK
jgi:bacteriorhodopsin